MMAEVVFENISKVFRERREHVVAVDKLNLAVDDRRLVVLVGPSGCGKTTTLRLVAGLEEATTGTIQIDGRDVTHVEPKDRNIAMVFQNHALYPHMTVYMNMSFGLKMRRVSKKEIRRKVSEAADLLGIARLMDRKPAELSGGECQRVALGRAIVRTPKVFLFDEPLSNLDAGLRLQMRTEIKSLQRRLAVTMVYVTHDQEEAMTLGHKLVIMNKGVVQQCGKPLEVYNRPVNRFVAGFIGTPRMNFLEGRLEGEGDEIVCETRSGRLALPKEVAEVVRSHTGQNVVLGIRPEHVRVGETKRTSSEGRAEATGVHARLSATVELVEPLGNVVNIHMSTAGGETVVARTSPEVSIHPGGSVAAMLDLSKVHVFGSNESGKRLN